MIAFSMEAPRYIVEAFTSKNFSGNPAAVVPLQSWLADETLAAIAKENNLPETAFFVSREKDYEIRWFTPAFEVDLCGHATMAAAYVIHHFFDSEMRLIKFHSKSGPLSVSINGSSLALDFPSRPGKPVTVPTNLIDGLGLKIQELFLDRDYMAVVSSEEEVVACKPKFELLQNLPALGVIITAPGRNCDFVSRAFYPTDAILEDPVTGSAHCTLIPYWSKRLKKKALHAWQLSAQGGELFCLDQGERVSIAGNARLHSRDLAYRYAA